MTEQLLDRPVYGMQQVDRLLALTTGTAGRWIDGYERGGKKYQPVVREQPTGADLVTWGEFVEVRLLAHYRSKGVSLHRLRPVVERLRTELQTKYPLAIARPYVLGRELVALVQDEVSLDKELRLVVLRTDQLMLTPPAEAFYSEVEWEDTDAPSGGYAVRLRPLGAASPVVFDPLRSFGEPVVRAVRTEVIAEEVRAGESPASIADAFKLTLDEVNEAVRYELVRRAA